jgi:hypothetical protein
MQEEYGNVLARSGTNDLCRDVLAGDCDVSASTADTQTTTRDLNTHAEFKYSVGGYGRLCIGSLLAALAQSVQLAELQPGRIVGTVTDANNDVVPQATAVLDGHGTNANAMCDRLRSSSTQRTSERRHRSKEAKSSVAQGAQKESNRVLVSIDSRS